MDRRSRKSSKASIEDDLAVVKAAAWAWYERGSGCETRAMREFDLSISRRREPKPSRYKIEAEAMKESQEMPPFSPLSSTASNSTEVRSLLDDYEIERISKQLDRYVESSRAGYFRSVFGIGGSSDEKRKPKSKSKSSSSSSSSIWLKYAAICSSRIEDVVQGRGIKVMYLRGGGGSRKKV